MSATDLVQPVPVVTAGVECLHCGTQYDPRASRWLCPTCKQKTVTCCEGSALPECR
ncbi:hypothetical protein GCM10027446_00220 [Angustibacter peucedani]